MNMKWIGITWYAAMIVCSVAFICGAPRFEAGLPLGMGIYWSIRNIRDWMHFT